jgi:hypothetical protein
MEKKAPERSGASDRLKQPGSPTQVLSSPHQDAFLPGPQGSYLPLTVRLASSPVSRNSRSAWSQNSSSQSFSCQICRARRRVRFWLGLATCVRRFSFAMR